MLRTVVVRLARAMGGGVDYWLGLPLDELSGYMLELNEQLRAESGETEGG